MSGNLRRKAMKKGLFGIAGLSLAAVTLFAPLQAAAQGRRPDVRHMTCEEAKALVQRAGAIVLTTGQYTYDRYVSGQQHCPMGLYTKDAWVSTRDGQSCRIGYTCVTEPPRFPLFRRD